MRREWFADSAFWECDAYDHGPFCRQCRKVTPDPPGWWPCRVIHQPGGFGGGEEVWVTDRG